MTREEFAAELDRIFCAPHAERGIMRLSETGLLAEHLPEVERLKGVEQPPAFHPEGDVFVHTMLMLSHISWPEADLGWAVLLHDVGKPAARTCDASGAMHFYGHEEIGAQMAEEILLRFGFGEARRERIVHAVRCHMRFAHFDRMRSSKQRSVINAPGFALELELHRVDCLCSNGLLGNYVLMLDLLHEEQSREQDPEPLLSGQDLIGAGFAPGPVFSLIFRRILQEQKAGRILTKEDALKFLCSFKDKMKCGLQ